MGGGGGGYNIINQLKVGGTFLQIQNTRGGEGRYKV